MHTRVGIRCFRSLDLSLITTEFKLSYTYSLTDLSQSGVESRLGNMGNTQWLLLSTSLGKAYELTWSQPAFGCQPAFKTSTWPLVDPLLCVFLAYFSSFSFFFSCERKRCKNLFKHWKRRFGPTNGILITRTLVKIHNKYLNVLFTWV